MDALQAITSATQIVSSMIGAVGALQSLRNLDEAPKKIENIEEFVSSLENLTKCVRQRHALRLHNPQLDKQIQSLTALVERLHPRIRKAKKILSKSKVKNIAKVAWLSVVGDPPSKLFQSIRDDLNGWLELQRLSADVEGVLESTARNMPVLMRIRINSDQGYPMSNKCFHVRSLLEKEDSQRVILIVGLSGMGKSCLARQVASDPPSQFVDGAVEVGLGKWCSRGACKGGKFEYHKRLARKMSRFLVQIGFMDSVKDEISEDLEDVCSMLQRALSGKRMLILLDDVWEQDIVYRFARLYDNDCRYLVTTRDEAVYEITEAEKVEICKEDIKEISKNILLYHSLLSDEELPAVGESLLERCGHHPLTVAVMGKALRKETSSEKWEKAIHNLSTYATCAPGPVSYVNEKEAEHPLTIFGSFEFSLEAMPSDSKRLFIALAMVSWVEPVPEACLEAIWSVLGKESLFLIVFSKLIESSLVIKTNSSPMYQVHDMVSLYLSNKVSDAIRILLTDPSDDRTAYVTPWLFIFGQEMVRKVAEEKIRSFLDLSNEQYALITLEAIVKALMASKSISEFEASGKSFCSVLGPRVTEFISVGSLGLIAASAKAITNIFTKEDYTRYLHCLENTDEINKLLGFLENCSDPSTLLSISLMVSKIAEHGRPETSSKILACLPMDDLADLLTPSDEGWHESVFTILMSLIKVGKSKAVERMVSSGIDAKLVGLLEGGSEVVQHHAIVVLKAIYEFGGPFRPGCLQHGTLNVLPWHVRLGLEKFIISDGNMRLSPKLQTFEELINKILDGNNEQVLDAMQDLITLLEKAGDPVIQDMMLQSLLIERLAALLRHGHAEQNRVRSESAFILMKLAFSGGEPFIRKFMEHDIILELVKMMQYNTEELQDSAYAALHQMVFGGGGNLVLNQILQKGIIERLASSLDSKSLKTREVCMLFLVDLIEVGSKMSIERMISSQVVEKLVSLEKCGGKFKGVVVSFLKGLDKCKNITPAERKVMKQQVVRKVRTAVKGHKLESSLIVDVETYIAEGSRRASSSRLKKI